jgi:hypothetical protein
MNDALTKRVAQAMNTTWEACGADFIQLTVEYENRSHCTFEEVCECVVDADRMTMYGGDKEATDAFYAIPYDKKGMVEKERILKVAFPDKSYGM